MINITCIRRHRLPTPNDVFFLFSFFLHIFYFFFSFLIFSFIRYTYYIYISRFALYLCQLNCRAFAFVGFYFENTPLRPKIFGGFWLKQEMFKRLRIEEAHSTRSTRIVQKQRCVAFLTI